MLSGLIPNTPQAGLLIGIGLGIVAAGIGSGLWLLLGGRRLSSARKDAEKIAADAQKEANSIDMKGVA